MNSVIKLNTLQALDFDNSFTRALPGDSESVNKRRQVSGACYSRVTPTSVSRPHLVACAREVAQTLDLDEQACASDLFTQVFSGNQLLPGMDPYASCYGGHQFGNWAGQLGDGRAINLGEVLNSRGERLSLQLKGAGPTPYSRDADGLAVLRSSLREFLCSEAMHHLGVPTTRALSLVVTGEEVMRDMLYDGHPRLEPGAVVCRVAPTFIRFGNFQIHAARGETALLRRLADYTISTFFPHLGAPSPETYLAWFREVCRSTVKMIVHWMRVGFVHGVMNTDNMSILGLTIDYGPYGWLDNYDQGWTPNTTDAGQRRYRFGEQARIAQWNLLQLANAIYPLIEQAEPLEQALNEYAAIYEQGWQRMMADKLGLASFDDALVSELTDILQQVETDMTLFYRRLALLRTDMKLDDEREWRDLLMPAWYQPQQLDAGYRSRMQNWLHRYLQQLKAEGVKDEVRQKKMNAVNPVYVFRNYLAQLAIDKAEEGDYSMVHELLALFRHPYGEQPGREKFAEKRPEWARQRPGCSMLSCSS